MHISVNFLLQLNSCIYTTKDKQIPEVLYYLILLRIVEYFPMYCLSSKTRGFGTAWGGLMTHSIYLWVNSSDILPGTIGNPPHP